MKKIDVILQARENSKRFHSKIFRNINGKSILEIIVKEIKKSREIDRFFIATSKFTNKKKILKISKKYNCIPFFGQEKNVLKRFYEITNKYKVKHILRLTADNIFISSKFIDKVCLNYKKNNYDYYSNLLKVTFPEGYTFEIFNKKTLDKISRKSNSVDREHVTVSVVKGLIKVHKKKNYEDKIDHSHLRLTCDYKEDFDYIKKLFYNFKKIPSYYQLLKFIKKKKLFNYTKKKSSIHYSK